ncbi:hypothetical protein D9V37_06815 [Nocardioides mangrovicus]|uniref:Uncharacterized protein n=1 Tax=Nocardioides mangrovicus TaxID=2478913 RepID=A0A3L8P2U1_9ACTN|nr:DUF6406 domain-containing protein [Nocardioides mangrovicus]RLV49625.1 hypothetical protein D9V37_06815 [Nocardioides mangrovicus]
MGRLQITVRRGTPFDLDGGARLTINDMRTDPDRAVLAVTGAGDAVRTTAATGDVVDLAGRSWLVESVIVGDRGSVVLVGAEE